MVINKDKSFCYRITHRDNLMHLLKYGLVCKQHTNANADFVPIGNQEIIDVRSSMPVNIKRYGNVGEYVPFYLTPRSIMLYNIITGYYAPVVPRRSKDEIIVIRCLIKDLIELPKWFFTDGQANDGETIHYNDLKHIDKIDWKCIQESNFTKSDGDYDRSRRYQAEFLVHDSVSIEYIESICVYNKPMLDSTEQQIRKAGLNIPVHIHTPYFFD